MNLEQLTETLIDIESVTGNEQEILNFIEDYLIKNKFTGEIIKNDGGLIAYHSKSNSKVAWVDWIISDKNYKDKESRKEGIIYLIQALTEICKQLGYAYCYALVKHDGLIKTYEDLGYIKADNYNQELIKHL